MSVSTIASSLTLTTSLFGIKGYRFNTLFIAVTENGFSYVWNDTKFHTNTLEEAVFEIDTLRLGA